MMIMWALAMAGCCGLVLADTTVDAVNRNAYGANAGWLNARGDVSHGAVFGALYCTGYVWSANCGWIGLGNGPTNHWNYSNASSNDWGVNHDGAGNLSGYAYGANIGWVTFEQTNGHPRLDLRTGNLSGYAYGANVGWISLSNAQGFAQTGTLEPGPDSDNDGLPDAWEYAQAGNLTALIGGTGDRDRDGLTDEEEYIADTDPLAKADFLEIVSINTAGSTNGIVWTSRPTRLYRLEATNALGASGGWLDVGPGLLGPPALPLMTQTVSGVTATAHYYRVQAVMPLSN